MASGDFDPERLLAALANADVQFILIGGIAAILHGDASTTLDVDVVPEREAENLQRLAAALRKLRAKIRAKGEPEGVPFDGSGAFFGNLAPDSILNLTTSAGDLDLTFQPSGTRGFADLRRSALEIQAAGVRIRIASLADVIRSKEAAGREKDRLALPRLRRLLDRLTEPD